MNAWEGVHASFNKTAVEFEEGQRFTGGAPKATRPGLRAGQVPNKREEDGYGAVRALDPVTGEKKWEFKMADVTQSGILTTVTDLLLTGGREGFFQALDARTGKMLWRRERRRRSGDGANDVRGEWEAIHCVCGGR